MAIERSKLEVHLTSLLKPHLYRDYGPNGLQIEGRDDIQTLAFAVSATHESISMACEKKADTLIVHHGLFWDFHGVRTITGPFAQRLFPLIRNKINLFGYHLPLDGQQDMGNAASIARLLRMRDLKPFGDHKGMPTGITGTLPSSKSVTSLRQELTSLLNHSVLVSANENSKMLSTLAIITGGANGGWKEAATQKIDGFLTGEMSEHDWNEAKEAGVAMFAGGHHATEVFGIQSLLKNVQGAFSELECFFIPSDNPA